MATTTYKRQASVKKHYAVYIVHQGDGGCYGGQELRYYLGDTWAVSPEKACSNVRYRTSGKSYSYYINGDIADEGSYSVFYEAEEI